MFITSVFRLGELQLYRGLKLVFVRRNQIFPGLRSYCFTRIEVVRSGKPTIMKLVSHEFKSIFTPELQVLKDLFNKHGYELRIAGGAVRDLLMNKTPQDLDFATTATPDQMKQMFTEEEIRMINMQGEKHGTITPRINDKENFEITTLRIDVVTDGRHAEVQFTKDWELDANRRDLTINSMFLGLDGTVYDYFSGYKDLMDRRVVFVGDPNTRIQEDYLRILRYFRFYGKIAKDPDNHNVDTLKRIKENAAGLTRISGERIWSELQKILEGNFAEQLMRTMIDVNLGPHLGLPDHPDIQEFHRVCNRKVQNLRAVSLIAALINTQEEFLAFHARCKLSRFDRDLGLFLIAHREDEVAEKPLQPYQQIVIFSKQKLTDIKEYVKELFRYKGDEHLLKEFESWSVPQFPVSGSVLKEKGVPQGKVLGSVVQKLKQYWVENDFAPSAEELLLQLPEVMLTIEIEKDKNKKS